MHFSGIYPEGNSAKYLSIADTGVKIIYLEHETID
jgi:hypothetical protein